MRSAHSRFWADAMHISLAAFRARPRVRFRDEVARPVRWRGCGCSRLGQKKTEDCIKTERVRKHRGEEINGNTQFHRSGLGLCERNALRRSGGLDWTECECVGRWRVRRN